MSSELLIISGDFNIHMDVSNNPDTIRQGRSEGGGAKGAICHGPQD